MTQFTPAPWRVAPQRTSLSVRGPDGRTIATIRYNYDPKDKVELKGANAWLIRSAPELFGACMKAAAQFRFYEKNHRAKGTPEADEKAEVNRQLAEELEALCERAKGVVL